ncbi:MAG: protein kinase [Gordonia sp. (in: high G+C Gram-positive bacteria)]|uniref:protein kinase domain-containing protein n=1 Tax=Gordonia sp. (in: high G+C Gram-positive bacteria) TaxID=84139 RepID=UPI0039E5F079
MALEPGDEFAGYRVIEVLGTGGMGTVYRVANPRLARDEALKTVKPTPGIADADERFRREARAAANLHHPGIVTIHEFGVTDDTPWYTMAFLDGEDLAKVAGRLPAREVSEIIGRVGPALDYAHAHDVIHRDVKPGNIILTRGANGLLDRVVLVDFGIVKDVAQSSTQLTQPFQPLGSPPYMAPEVIRGEPATAASDQYALAVTAYQALTGHAPFTGATGELLAAHATAPVPSVTRHRPDLAAVDPVLNRALAKDPAQRFGSCAEFAEALDRSLAGSSRDTIVPAPLPPPPAGITAPPPTSYGAYPYPAPFPPPRKKRRKGLYAALAALLVIAAGTTGGVLWHRSTQEPPQRAEWQLANPAGAKPGAWTALSTASSAYGPRTVCGINDGDVYCWGESNERGQLGNGKFGGPTTASKVAGLKKPTTAVAVAPDFSCAIHDGGKAMGCWGADGGHMGVPKPPADPATTSTPAPAPAPITAVSVSTLRGCIVKTAKLRCWGNLNSLANAPLRDEENLYYGQVNVSIFGSASKVVVRSSTMCVVSSVGKVTCQGITRDGKMVTSADAKPSFPDEMPLVKDIEGIDADGDGWSWCAFNKTAVYCWGTGTDGVLGNGEGRSLPQPPAPVAGLSKPTDISGGAGFFCAVDGGSVYCWGKNNTGQLGQERAGQYYAPTKVEGLHNVTAVSAGRDFACAIADGERYCWGKPPE